jgi:alkylhydroperoxidase family enzyme
MRLDVLNSGDEPGTKVLFGVIRLFSGHPVPDAARIVLYRPDFYGDRAKASTHEAMRGPSAWSVADRELMAASVANVVGSAFCVGAHTATAGQEHQAAPPVAAVLSDVDSTPFGEPLRVGLERTTVPLIGTETFGLSRATWPCSRLSSRSGSRRR